MDAMTRSLVVKGDILTVSTPRQGVGVEMRNGYYDEEPRGKRDIVPLSPPRQGVEMRNGYHNKEPRGQKRFSHRKVSSSRGRGSQEQ